jgi:CRP/FNR family transcriptional regulator, anaerobic regulatory protein
MGDTIATLSQRDATERVARAQIRIFQRLHAIGTGRPGAVAMPFRPQDPADAPGLPLVHANKTLTKLRHLNLADWGRGVLRVPDVPGPNRPCNRHLDRPEAQPLL